ncbi:MAG: hypothetical protein H6629_02120 [Calditrichae bacterium]|nr:hypothetical protein [Calditrichia bacterium]
MNAINTFLRENWQRFKLSRFGDGTALSSVLLTPGFQASSHIIAFVLTDGQPTAKMVVKLPRIPGDHARLDIEAANLRYLFNLRKSVFPGTPEVLAYDNWHGHKMLVETMVPGSVLRPAAARAQLRFCAANRSRLADGTAHNHQNCHRNAPKMARYGVR